ncbi:MAG: hypothetical protein IPM42_10515 [Saprospiraceae bacterium]|nr:hypothetical protein [Saprospiraceae bacterium]
MFGCKKENQTISNGSDTKEISYDSLQKVFWTELQNLCGNVYTGSIIAGPENDTVFAGKNLVMHIRNCNDTIIRIPFFVGEDSSRTWVLTLKESGILLKHDHRHVDGTSDKITMYGGQTSNSGSSEIQIFPADPETAELLPVAIGNVWWIELKPDVHFTYNLRRVNTDRYFSVKFDLSNPVTEIPGLPWGWKD